MREQKPYRILCILLLTLVASSFSVVGWAADYDYPDEVVIDSMTELFEGVVFDHELHADLGEDCSVCHHHTTGTGTADEACISCHADSPETDSVACAECHVVEPFSADQINKEAQNIYQYHVDQPGLKAAYHWNCIGCHKAMDGPVACEDCHARTAAGDDFYHADAVPSPTAHAGH